jgi:hypothetical protein
VAAATSEIGPTIFVLMVVLAGSIAAGIFISRPWRRRTGAGQDRPGAGQDRPGAQREPAAADSRPTPWSTVSAEPPDDTLPDFAAAGPWSTGGAADDRASRQGRNRPG